MRFRSPDTAAEYRRRRVLVRRILTEQTMCVVCGNARATAIHEPLTRARGGSILDEKNCVPICAPCHMRVHEDRDGWATAAGWLRHSWDGDNHA
jgi:hypothetical protein